MLKHFLLTHFPIGLLSRLWKIYQMRITLAYYLMRVFPINNKKVVFSNFYGKGYGDNGKYIAEEILSRELDYDLVWLVNNTSDHNFPMKIRTVRKGTLRAVYEEVTAKVWIDNCRKYWAVRKRKEQYYIQTWHGGIGPKRIEKDAENSLSKGYIADAKNDSKMANLMISNSSFKTRDYKEAFWYGGEILECGSPRNDILFEYNPKRLKTIRQKLNLDEGCRTVLYAPTFRSTSDMAVYSIDYELCLSALKTRFGGEWVLLERLHPNINQLSIKRAYSDKVINVSSYNDVQELLLLADVLITDYSSIIYDFMLTKKPAFIFATDIEEYMKDRNFRFDIRNLAIPLAENNEELHKCITAFDENDYREGLVKMFLDFGICENGVASKKVVDRIINVIEAQ